LINALIAQFQISHAPILVARSHVRPNPIVFGRELYPALLTLTGDDTGFSLLEKHADKVALLEWPEEENLQQGKKAFPRLKERV
jgi:hypothetical protein